MSPAMDVTVVVPTFRGGTRVGPALRSALDQEGVRTRVILVDDASGDGSREELERFVSSRVQILEQWINGGAPAARQAGTEMATTDVVAYLDDDDVWAPRHLVSCLEAMSRCGARWGYSGVTWVDAELRPLTTQPLVEPAAAYRRLLDGNGLVTPSCLVVERKLVNEVGGWDARLRSIGDWELMLRLAAVAAPASSGQHSVLYIRHDASMSRTALARAPEELAHVVRRHRPLARQQGLRLGTGQFWRWLAFNADDGGQRMTAARFYLRAAAAERNFGDIGRAFRALTRR